MNANPTPKLCECGCGEPAPICDRNHTKYGYVIGQPKRFIRGHGSRPNRSFDTPRECACGCGGLTIVYKGRARRFIHGHNSEFRRIGPDDYTVEDRGFETPCWIWAHPHVTGRGNITVRGKKTLAYRVMYEQEVGPIPEGKVVHHRCEEPYCIRVTHLEVMTQSEHIKRHGMPSWKSHQTPSRLGNGATSGDQIDGRLRLFDGL